MRRLGAAIVLALGGICVACGGSSLTTEVDGGATDAGVDGSQSTDGASPGGPCPASVPAAKSACSEVGLSCEYGGTGDHLLCSTIASCEPSATGAPQWFVSPPASGCVASQAQNPIGCPSSYASLATGSPCPREPASECVYTEGVCGCVPCMADGGSSPKNEWLCEAWSAPSGCPEPRPRIGSACTQEGLSCMYTNLCGVNDGQPWIGCRSGRWVMQAYGADCVIRSCGT